VLKLQPASLSYAQQTSHLLLALLFVPLYGTEVTCSFGRSKGLVKATLTFRDVFLFAFLTIVWLIGIN
jgi:hypothetical protein